MKWFSLLFALLLVMMMPAQVRQPAPTDRISVLRSITVEAGEAAADVVCFICAARVRGNVARDITTFGGGIEIDGKVEGDAVAIGGGIHLRPQADVSGDVIAMGGAVKQEAGAQVAGEVFPMAYLFFPGQRQPLVLGFLSLLAFNLLFTLIFFLILRQRRIENLAAASRERPIVTTIVGLLLLVAYSGLFYAVTFLDQAMFVAEILLFLTLLAIIVAGFAGVSYGIGRRIAGSLKPAKVALAGAALLTVLEAVPVLGFLVSLAIIFAGSGAVVVTRFGRLGRAALSETVSPG